MSTIYDYSVVLDNRTKVISPRTSPSVPEEYALYTNKVDHNQLTYTTTGITGVGMAQVISDGQIPSSDAPVQGYTKSFNQIIFTARVRLSQQAAYFLFNSKDGAKIDADVQSKVLNLKNAIVHSKNYFMQSLLAQGFSTGFSFSPINPLVQATSTVVDTTTADGVAYWSAAHTREDGGSNWSNLVVSSGVTNPLFSFAALMASRTNHAAKKDGRGMPLIGSQLDTFVFQYNSTAYYLASSINGTLKNGKYPSATPGTTGTFVDANPTASFEVIGLQNYGSTAPQTAITSIMWFGFDSKQINKDTGFQYIETMPITMSSWYTDYAGNMDQVLTATNYCIFGANDLRYWMASSGLLS